MPSAFQPLSISALLADLPGRKRGVGQQPITLTPEDVKAKQKPPAWVDVSVENGRPSGDFQSLPVISRQALLADALSTKKKVTEPIIAERAPIKNLTYEELSADLPQAKQSEFRPLTAAEQLPERKQPETVSPQYAPFGLEQPINRLGPYPETIQAGMTSNNPAVRHQARHAALGAHADYVEPDLPDEPQIADHSGEHRNFIQNVGHHLKHGLRAGLIGLGEGGLGGGLLGLVGGTASPKFADTLQHNLIDEPKWKADVARIEGQAATRRAGYQDIAAMTGRTLDDEPTVAGQNADTARRNAERAAQDSIFNQGKSRAQFQQAEDRLAHDRYKTWAATQPTGTPIPDNLADAAKLPRGSTVYHHVSAGPLVKGPDGSTFRVGESNNLQPVIDPKTGQPFKQNVTQPHEPQTPAFVYNGRARAELKNELKITNENALVENPEHEQYFQTLKAENDASVREYGADARLSDEALHARAAKKYPRQVRAGTLITPEMVSQRAAQIYEREGGGHNKMAAPSSSSSPASAKPDAAQMKVDKDGYKQLYNRMTPEHRKQYEEGFKAKYNRYPQKP